MTYSQTLKAISIHAPHAYAICMGINRLIKTSKQKVLFAGSTLSGIRPDISIFIFHGSGLQQSITELIYNLLNHRVSHLAIQWQ